VTDEGLARAALSLADALARGDASKIEKLITRPARAVVDSLRDTGEWATATKGIEAVRIVYAGPNAGGGPSLEQIGQMITSPEFAAHMQQVASALAGATGAAAEGETPPAPPSAEQLKQQWDQFMEDPAMEEAREQLRTMLASLPGLDSGPKGEYLVVTAIQDSQGAYLLGWGAQQAAGDWVFSNEPTVNTTKSRAADFDNIGMGAFATSGVQVAQAPTPPADAGTTPEDPAAAQDPNNPSGPIRKNTPAGPVTIPSPSGPGGG
jgi:hypothetical protein